MTCRPGQRYQPSNGTEGEGFMARFCMECERDRATWEHDDPANGCPIIARSMIFDVADDEYPREWTYDEAGKPTCTAFVPIGTRLPTDSELEAAGQMTLLEPTRKGASDG